MANDAGSAETNQSLLANPGVLNQWTDLIDKVLGTSSNTSGSSTTTNSSAADGPLQALLAQLTGTAGQGATNANIQALIAPIFAQLRDGALPGIQGQANAGGGVYNSSTQRLLQNDALARATAQAGGAVVSQQNNQMTQLLTLLATLAKSTASQQTNSNQNTSKPGSAANLGKAALGAGAAGAAAKALKGLMGNKDTNNGDGDPEKGGTSTISGSPSGGTGADDEAAFGGINGALGGNDDPGAIDSLDQSANLTGESGFYGDSDGHSGSDDFSWLSDFFNSSNEPADAGFDFVGNENSYDTGLGEGDSGVDSFE